MLNNHIDALRVLHLKTLFPDPTRTAQMTITAAGITLDFSHQRLLPETLPILDIFAREQGLHERIQALMDGEKVNVSESRPALHTALRRPLAPALMVEGEDIMPQIHTCLDRMEALCEQVAQSPLTDVVVLGMGGSYWGSASVCQALQLLPKRVNVHFLGEMEEEAFQVTTAGLSPERTLFIVISKSFTTPETLFNAELARAWLGDCVEDKTYPHMIAVTANDAAAKAFGISADHLFDMWPWVGGRYSVWSAVGLPIAISYGFDVFKALLSGAYAIDQHTLLTANASQNMPLMAALCTFLNIRYFGAQSEAILPYGFRLAHLVPYIQQLSMESLGKQRNLAGERIVAPTGPIVWGQTGLHAQHTFNQLLYQGNHCVSIEFILPLENNRLVSACLAQSHALTHGDAGNSLPHARIEGNQPHQLIQFQSVTPEALGALMAFYEHKTYILACLMGVNAFDQFGVQLAKVIKLG